MSDLVVAKLGGSLVGSPYLRDWLTALASVAGRVVVVPGGGPFADAVRGAQPVMRFSDRAAHAMALLAMEQMAHAFADLEPAFRRAGTIAEIERLRAAGLVPVWLPTAMVLAARDVAASWEVTSDSLALWLARQIGARRAIVVKQARLPGETSAEDLAARGVVDRAFPRMLERTGVEAWLVGPEPPDSPEVLLAGRAVAGCTRVAPAVHA